MPNTSVLPEQFKTVHSKKNQKSQHKKIQKISPKSHLKKSKTIIDKLHLQLYNKRVCEINRCRFVSTQHIA